MRRIYAPKLPNMPWAVCLMIWICIATDATAADTEPVTPPLHESQRQLDGDKFVLGDQLKITVYENFAAVNAEPSGLALMSLVERSEITGNYVVQEDGSIFLPLVGGIVTADRTVTELENEIRMRFASKISANVAVAIQLLDREPIYLTGDLPQSGTFRYSPGMTALHVMALAGGTFGQGADSWRQIDLARERERVVQGQNRLARLLARMSVLIAEKGGFDDDSRLRLIELVGQSSAERMIAEEQAVRELEQEQLVSQSAAAVGVIASLENERDILKESQDGAEAALTEKATRLHFMEDLRKRGTTTDQNINIVRDEYIQAQSAWNDVRAMLARVERTLVETRHNDARVSSDYHIATERAFMATKQSITEEETTRSLMANVLLTMQNLSASGDRAGTEMRVEIVRRTPRGIVKMQGDLLFPVRPGDILNVQRREKKTQQESASLVR